MKKTIVLLDWIPSISWYPSFAETFFGLAINKIFEEYFNIELYDSKKNYDKNQCVFVICNIYDKEFFLNKLKFYKSLEEKNFKIIVWLFGEYPPIHHFNSFNNFPIFYIPHWFWFQEISRFVDRYHSYFQENRLVLHKHNYPRGSERSKLALMPIGKLRTHRKILLEKVFTFLGKMVYSNTTEGILLPRNIDYENQNNLYEIRGILNDRYFNPDWYNETYFSLVSETTIDSICFKYNKNNYAAPVFITEKTWKPIMFKHPFMIFGQPQILKYLKELGFETFNNLFDESYDTIDNNNVRLDTIIKNIKHLERSMFTANKKTSTFTYDKLTEEKIQHNYHLFFNETVVEHRIVNDIITPFLEMSE
jgi:hypothetical protein